MDRNNPWQVTDERRIGEQLFHERLEALRAWLLDPENQELWARHRRVFMDPF